MYNNGKKAILRSSGNQEEDETITNPLVDTHLDDDPTLTSRDLKSK